MMNLRKFMFENLYSNPAAKSEEIKVKKMIEKLFEYFKKNYKEVPENYRKIVSDRGEDEETAICDYIASMSDQYSIKVFKDIFVPRAWEY